jgi:hypothetical protein
LAEINSSFLHLGRAPDSVKRFLAELEADEQANRPPPKPQEAERRPGRTSKSVT